MMATAGHWSVRKVDALATIPILLNRFRTSHVSFRFIVIFLLEYVTSNMHVCVCVSAYLYVLCAYPSQRELSYFIIHYHHHHH